MAMLRPLFVLFALIFTLAACMLFLACGILVVSHGGLSVEFFKALALLVLDFGLLMACNRYLTGQWHRWSRPASARAGHR